MRVLITGAAGFVGSTIADLVRERGDEVVAVDALLPIAHTGRPDWVPDDLIVADLRDREAVANLLSGVDVVCHQAAMVGLGKDLFDFPDYLSHNAVGTAVLLSEMARAGLHRLVQASSMVVYGEGAYDCAEHGRVRPTARPAAQLAAGHFEPGCPHCRRPLTWRTVDESATPDPRNAYAIGKLAQEQLAAVWANQTDSAAVSLRYHNIYGPRMPRDTPYAGVAAIFRSALEAGGPPMVLEDGRQMRDFVHVNDVAAANLLAIDRAATHEGHESDILVCNIASGAPHSIGELAAAMSAAADGPAPVIAGGGRPGDVRHVVADPAFARRELGFRATVEFAEGVREFLRAPMRAPTGVGRTLTTG